MFFKRMKTDYSSTIPLKFFSRLLKTMPTMLINTKTKMYFAGLVAGMIILNQFVTLIKETLIGQNVSKWQIMV